MKYLQDPCSQETLADLARDSWRNACSYAAFGMTNMREYSEGKFFAFNIAAGNLSEFKGVEDNATVRNEIFSMIRAMRLRLEEK